MTRSRRLTPANSVSSLTSVVCEVVRRGSEVDSGLIAAASSKVLISEPKYNERLAYERSRAVSRPVDRER